MGSPLSRLMGYACAAVGAAFFSTKAIFIKLAFQDQLDASLFLAYRMIFATPFFVAIGLWAYAKRRAKGEAPPDLSSAAWAALIGLIGYYVASAFDFAGLQYISASLERLVLFTYPLFVMFIGAALYGEAVTSFGIAAAVVTYVGLAIVFAVDLPAGGRNTLIGTALILGAAISFAWHQILAKRVILRLGSAHRAHSRRSGLCTASGRHRLGQLRGLAAVSLAGARVRDRGDGAADVPDQRGACARLVSGGLDDRNRLAGCDDRPRDHHPRRAVHRGRRARIFPRPARSRALYLGRQPDEDGAGEGGNGRSRAAPCQNALICPLRSEHHAAMRLCSSGARSVLIELVAP